MQQHFHVDLAARIYCVHMLVAILFLRVKSLLVYMRHRRYMQFRWTSRPSDWHQRFVSETPPVRISALRCFRDKSKDFGDAQWVRLQKSWPKI